MNRAEAIEHVIDLADVVDAERIMSNEGHDDLIESTRAALAALGVMPEEIPSTFT